MLALFLAALLLAPPPPSEPTSAAVTAAVERHGKRITPALISKLDALSSAGDMSAAQLLGEILSNPQGTPDYDRACGYFERASAARADSTHNLATCFFQGRGRPQDPAKARLLYKQASERGFAGAHCALGNMLITGTGGPRDPARGLQLCRSAAEAGNAHAQADYGEHLLSGVATAKDAAAARKWLTAAAEQGHANAALILGKVHWNGDGTTKSNREAARWWLVAHKGGRAEAAFLLGQEAFVRLFNSGSTPDKADPKILDEALGWLAIAEEKDTDPNARAKAGLMSAQLLPFKGKLGRRR